MSSLQENLEEYRALQLECVVARRRQSEAQDDIDALSAKLAVARSIQGEATNHIRVTEQRIKVLESTLKDVLVKCTMCYEGVDLYRLKCCGRNFCSVCILKQEQSNPGKCLGAGCKEKPLPFKRLKRSLV